MPTIPLEILTMGSSAVLGGFLKAMDRRAERDLRLVDALNKDARERLIQDVPQSIQWTRRAMALIIVLSVMVLPKIAALMGYEVNYGTAGEQSLLWGLFGSSPHVEWYIAGGVPITPMDTHSLAAVVGLYFGGRR